MVLLDKGNVVWMFCKTQLKVLFSIKYEKQIRNKSRGCVHFTIKYNIEIVFPLKEIWQH